MTGKRKQPANAKRHFKRAKYADGGASKLEAGMTGVLVSHDRNKERSCRLDCFRLLNYFGDKLYGPENSEEGKIENQLENEDIESALSSEVDGIKAGMDKKSQKERRFSTVKSGCNNLIFVRFNGVQPSVLMKHIVEHIFSCQNLNETDIPLVRDVLRVHPVEFTCSAYLDSMCKNIPLFLETKFSEMADAELKEYTIEYKCRNNSHLSRQGVLDGLCSVLKVSPSGWKYNCRAQCVSVIIDVLKTVCLVSVVRDYYRYKRYNIRELLQKKPHSESATATTDKIHSSAVEINTDQKSEITQTRDTVVIAANSEQNLVETEEASRHADDVENAGNFQTAAKQMPLENGVQSKTMNT